MEKDTRYIAIRITEKQYEIWRHLPYGKSKHIGELVKSFPEEEKTEYLNIQQTIIDLPPSLLEKRQIAVEKDGLTKEDLMVFFGYIAKLLSECRGDTEEVIRRLKRRLEYGG